MEWLENPDYADLNRATPLRCPSAVRDVMLVQRQNGQDSRTIWAGLLPDGSLQISGQDLGPIVERFFGFAEYEFAHTIPAGYVQPFLELLGSPNNDVLNAITQFSGTRYSELSEAIEQAKATMPIQFWSRP